MGLYILPQSSTEVADAVVQELAIKGVTCQEQHQARIDIIEAGTHDDRNAIQRTLQGIAVTHDIELPFEEKGHR